MKDQQILSQKEPVNWQILFGHILWERAQNAVKSLHPLRFGFKGELLTCVFRRKILLGQPVAYVCFGRLKDFNSLCTRYI